MMVSVALRDAKADLPIKQNMGVIRSLSDLQYALGKKSGIDTEILQAQSGSKTKKTKFNIPITDVSVDKDYEANLRALYSLPTSYVRYARRIGDEADMATDYNLEVEDKKWMATHSLLGTDKDAKKHLTSDAFEAIIDILERHTGYSKDTVPQLHVQQLVVDKLCWEPHVAAKILPYVYTYWLKKRDAAKKPLCRRYWPQTPAADNNPHLTFRPRDKEKYRLRKQHRKNDLDAFRKMQQLRREFGKAHDLLCLLVERESLREAELEVKKEIFEQTLWDISHMKLSGSKASKPPPARRAVQFSHSLRFEELLKETEQPVAAIALDDPIWNNLSGRKGVAPAGLTSGGSHAAQSQRAAQEAEARKTARRVQQAQHAQHALRKRTMESEAPPQAPQHAPGPGPGPVTGLVPSHQRAMELVTLQHMHATLPGPRTACRPSWPHFLDANPLRDPWTAPASLSQYLDDLGGIDEDVYPEAPAGVGGHFSRIGGVGGMLGAYRKADTSEASSSSSSSSGGAMDTGEGEDAVHVRKVAEVELTRHRRTLRYRFRGRVGRGGRLVMDRIPIYTEPPARSAEADASMSFAHFDEVFKSAAAEAALSNMETCRKQQHIYGGSFREAASDVRYLQASTINCHAPMQQQSAAPAAAAPATAATSKPGGATGAGAGGGSTAASNSKPTPQRGEIYIVPPTHPQERPIVLPGLAARQSEIYACSDSEDEALLYGMDSEQRRLQIIRQKVNSLESAENATKQTALNFNVVI